MFILTIVYCSREMRRHNNVDTKVDPPNQLTASRWRCISAACKQKDSFSSTMQFRLSDLVALTFSIFHHQRNQRDETNALAPGVQQGGSVSIPEKSRFLPHNLDARGHSKTSGSGFLLWDNSLVSDLSLGFFVLLLNVFGFGKKMFGLSEIAIVFFRIYGKVRTSFFSETLNIICQRLKLSFHRVPEVRNRTIFENYGRTSFIKTEPRRVSSLLEMFFLFILKQPQNDFVHSTKTTFFFFLFISPEMTYFDGVFVMER